MENEATVFELKTFNTIDGRIAFIKQQISEMEKFSEGFKVEAIHIEQKDIVKAYFGPGHWYVKKLPEKCFRFDTDGNINIEANHDRHYDVVPAVDIIEMFSKRIPGYIMAYAMVDHDKHYTAPLSAFIVFRIVAEDKYADAVEVNEGIMYANWVNFKKKGNLVDLDRVHDIG